MKKLTMACASATALLMVGTAALAQTPAPSESRAVPQAMSAASQPAHGTPSTVNQPSGYTGPSSATVMSVKQLLDSGKDDQYVRLQGRIVSSDGDKKYTFADDSGRMTVEISPRRFPAGQSIGAEQRVEVSGEVDKGFRKMEFEVKEMRMLP